MRGRGVFELGNPEGRGGLKQFWKSRRKGQSKKHAFHRGGVDHFWNNQFNNMLKEYLTLRVAIAGPGCSNFG